MSNVSPLNILPDIGRRHPPPLNGPSFIGTSASGSSVYWPRRESSLILIFLQRMGGLTRVPKVLVSLLIFVHPALEQLTPCSG